MPNRGSGEREMWCVSYPHGTQPPRYFDDENEARTFFRKAPKAVALSKVNVKPDDVAAFENKGER